MGRKRTLDAPSNRCRITIACRRPLTASAALPLQPRLKSGVEQTGSVLHGTRTPRLDAGRVPITYRILKYVHHLREIRAVRDSLVPLCRELGHGGVIMTASLESPGTARSRRPHADLRRHDGDDLRCPSAAGSGEVCRSPRVTSWGNGSTGKPAWRQASSPPSSGWT